jgi:hypothetical protein
MCPLSFDLDIMERRELKSLFNMDASFMKNVAHGLLPSPLVEVRRIFLESMERLHFAPCRRNFEATNRVQDRITP